MRRRADSGGFLLCLILNMIFRFEWIFFAAAVFIVCLIFHLSYSLVLIPLGLWFLHAFLVTAVLSAITRNTSVPDSRLQENKNPYSQKK